MLCGSQGWDILSMVFRGMSEGVRFLRLLKPFSSCTTVNPENLGSLSPHLDQSPKMSNRVKRDVRLEVAPGALGVTFEADYNGCAGKFFQHTHQMHDKNDLRFFNCVTLPLFLTQFYFLLQCIQPSSNDL